MRRTRRESLEVPGLTLMGIITVVSIVPSDTMAGRCAFCAAILVIVVVFVYFCSLFLFLLLRLVVVFVMVVIVVFILVKIVDCYTLLMLFYSC